MLQRLHQRLRRQRKKLAQVARLQARGLLYIPSEGQPDDTPAFDEALAAWGLQQEVDTDAPPPDDSCYLWPCNLPTFNAWQRVQTQWRCSGMGERTGLDYTAVIAYLRGALGIKQHELPGLLSGLQAMEFAALEVWAEQAREKS